MNMSDKPQKNPLSLSPSPSPSLKDSSSQPLQQQQFLCPSCNQTLPRHHFQKKEFKKKNGTPPICHYCKRKATAERTKQSLPTVPVERTIWGKKQDDDSVATTNKSTTVDPNDDDDNNNNINNNNNKSNITTISTASAFSSRAADSGMKRRPNNHGYCNYLDKLFGMNCFPEIVNLGVFTTAKDVSESMAAIYAASKHGNIMNTKDNNNDRIATTTVTPRRENILCLCIGDGSTPRTAVLTAFWKGWTCVSIDPQLSSKWDGVHPTVRGLTGYVGTLESYLEEEVERRRQQHTATTPPENDADNNDGNEDTKNRTDDSSTPVVDHLVLLCVHSHVQFRNTTRLSEIRAMYGNPSTTLVSIPCCPTYRHVNDIGRKPDTKYDDDCVFSAYRTVNVWNESAGNPEEKEERGDRDIPFGPGTVCTPVSS